MSVARVAVGVTLSSSDGGIGGVSDPHLAAPFFAPRAARRGSLTPQMRLNVVRQNHALSVASSSAPPLSDTVFKSVASIESASVRFFRKTAFL